MLKGGIVGALKSIGGTRECVVSSPECRNKETTSLPHFLFEMPEFKVYQQIINDLETGTQLDDPKQEIKNE